MDDLTIDTNYKKGDKNGKVKLIQEWLCLHGINIVIDGDFGPATDYAVRQFQKSRSMTTDGIVGLLTFEMLISPMTAALKTIPDDGKTLGQMMASYAQQHLAHYPREIGGQNKGPWVRLYMKGKEGKNWPWCAGFACFILEQACKTLNMAVPIASSFSSGTLAASAKKKAIFLAESKVTKKEQITAGSFFLVRKSASQWSHTGLVIKTEKDIFHTIEGNTNDEGSHEGYEVCARTRGYPGKDFILIS